MADYNKELSKVRGPFRVYPKKKKEEPISTLDDYQKAFIKGLESYDVKQKKPVRWNFFKDSEGLLNLGLTLAPDLRMAMAASLAKQGKKTIAILISGANVRPRFNLFRLFYFL